VDKKNRGPPKGVPGTMVSKTVIDRAAKRVSLCPSMAGPLVIVESPTKAKKITEFLRGEDTGGASPTVIASVGHIRDLVSKAKELPEGKQKEWWSYLGIDPDDDFKPYYKVYDKKKDTVAELRRALKNADALYLATDEDREGEAIAWHLLQVLKPPKDMPVYRMVFHEITAPAIREAFANPRELDQLLVDAQETRRLLDRLAGYDLSQVLWKKVNRGLSAGRVQSVATRLVVEREREIMAFVSADWWDIKGVFAASSEPIPFGAKLIAIDGVRVATGNDFNDDGALTRDDRIILNEETVRALAAELQTSPFSVRSVESKPYRKRPFAPFTTSTLQQVAGRRLKVSAKQVMSMAQSLYQQGYITYMRTDSSSLSAAAVAAAKHEITERYGAAAIEGEPRRWGKKAANAQEAHEAIRPAGDRFRRPEEVRNEVPPGEARLYEIIWQRTVASQMIDAIGETVTVRLGALTVSGRDAEFSAAGTVITERGWMQVEDWRTDDTDTENDDDTERRLPQLKVGDGLDATEITPEGHATKPPARFTEASLVGKMEELGVGRPSTYASIMETIQGRGYVWKKGSALVPSWNAFAVTTLLEQHFAELVDYDFTANLEAILDRISNGDANSVETLADFYFGPMVDGERKDGLRDLVTERLPEIDAAAINTFLLGDDHNGMPVIAKPGKFGPYVQRGDDTASVPDNLPPADLTVAVALELLAMPKGGKPIGEDPETGLTVFVMSGRFGPYVQLGELEDDPDGKPRRASLFKSMDPYEVTLEQGLELLSFPKVLGNDPETGKAIRAQNGKFGPYLTKGDEGDAEKPETRSLDSEEQLLVVTFENALALFAEPRRFGKRAPKPPLADLGIDPASGRPMVIKDGKFGPYVTDGETNASLRVGDVPETLSPERGAELLQDRRVYIAENGGPAAKKAAKKSVKKAAKKKATAKKSAKSRAKKPDPMTTRTVGAGQSKAAQKAAKRPNVEKSNSQILDTER
jgi:DNA topoisomerase I